MKRPLPELPGVSHRWVDAGGVRLHVAEAGSGEPVVCVHGWPQNWWEWRGIIPGLAERYRVICPDLRGFGWSEAPPSGYEKREFAADLAALLDALGLRDVRLIAHDWGGVAGFILCLERPDLVRQYLALNTAHPWPRIEGRRLPDLRRFWYQWVISAPLLGQMAVRQLARLPADQAYKVSGSSTAWDEQAARVFLGQFESRQRTWASVQTYRTFVTRELAALVGGRYRDKRLRAQTLWLHGTGDPVIQPFMLQGTEPYADDLTVDLVEGAGHFIADERPELVLERALAFFGGGDVGHVAGHMGT
ncbi:MAG TPA: alpha/beta hydrolase [Thermoleophilaceae bacterium]